MADTPAGPPADPTVMARHRAELQQRFPVYGLFDPVTSAGLTGEALEIVTAACATVAELAVAQELDGTAAEGCARALLAGEPAGVGRRFAAWRDCLAAADPDRPGMALALGSLGTWLAAAPAVEQALCEHLPRIAPVFAELKAPGVAEVVTAASTVPDAVALLSAAGAYGTTDGATVLGVIRLGMRAQAWGDPTVLTRLMAAIPPERTDESRDAERVIAAVSALVEACAARGEAQGRAAAALCLSLCALKVSSGYAVAVDVRKGLDRMDVALVLPYLEDVTLLATTVGVRAVGFALGTLPGLYARHGVPAVRGFVRTTAEVARSHGTTAAQWFYERRTAAARAALGT